MNSIQNVSRIACNIARIREKIHETCARLGRDPSGIRLMAVSKSYPFSSAEEAWKQGIRLFGENRVLEGREKFVDFPGRVLIRNPNQDEPQNTEVHLIGSLQRNKAKKAAEFFDCIQSVDRESLVNELGGLTKEREKPLAVFLEYHTGEESKSGFPDLDSLFRAAELVYSFPGLKPLGLMTMAPFTGDKKAIRASFRACAAALGEMEKRFGGNSWSSLSMGMSGDFEIALEEGSNLIRIGQAIFGERNP